METVHVALENYERVAALNVYCLPDFLLQYNTESFLKARFHSA